MAGIYLHIPFCKQKCSYCDFYSNTNLGISQALINSEIEELKLRQEYLRNETVSTIYFGGGTPSVLTLYQVEQLLKAEYDNFNVLNECEITFECNPDDLTFEYLKRLRQIGINRISIGVQSFNDEVLNFLNRRHSSAQASLVINQAKEAGFGNISIDLMFGIPGMSFESYRETLSKAIQSGVQHISAYQLTFEENTLLYKQLTTNKIQEIEEEESIKLLDYTIEKLNEFGFKQYEVSNYARAGFESRHNSNYWANISYLGIGPSAHSYDGKTRQWNISNSTAYIKEIELGKEYFNSEVLTEVDQYNEYIMTRLRTTLGVSVNYVVNTFNKNIITHFLKNIKEIVDDGFMICDDDRYSLNRKGFFILDFLVKKIYYM